jgi:transposase
VAIGRLDEKAGKLIPNAKYFEFYGRPDAQTPIVTYSSNRAVGASFLVGRIMDSLELTDVLDESLGVERSRLVQSAALYMVARDNVFDHVLEYCEGFTLNEAPLSSQSSSRLFASISFDDRMKFFKLWISKQKFNTYLAYDVTSFSTYAKNICDSEYGYNRDNERLPQINLGCFVSMDNGLPIFYTTYPGSITDTSHLSYMMAYNKDFMLTNVGFVLDRGFCSTKNIMYLNKNNLNYIIGVNKNHKSIISAIDLYRNSIPNLFNMINDNVYAKTRRGYFYGVLSNIHIFYDPIIGQKQKILLKKKIENQEKFLAKKQFLTKKEAKEFNTHFLIELFDDGSFTFERDYEKIALESSRCGCFCILTNNNLDSREILTKYRHKDIIEKNYDELKNNISMKRLHTHNSATTDGKLFCAFIALIVVSNIENILRNFMDERALSKKKIIDELEKIHVITTDNGNRLLNPITKTQRTIFESFGLTEEDLLAYIAAASPPAMLL